jgi:hypothetical protein
MKTEIFAEFYLNDHSFLLQDACIAEPWHAL